MKFEVFILIKLLTLRIFYFLCYHYSHELEPLSFGMYTPCAQVITKTENKIDIKER